MKECYRNPKGEKMCHIVRHPERNWETFCSECDRQFISKDEGVNFLEGIWLIVLILGFLLILVLLTGCEKQANLLLIRTTDISASSPNNSE